MTKTPNPVSQIDRARFFHGASGVAKTLFQKGLKAHQANGMERVLNLAADPDMYPMPLAHCAYILATAYHETGTRMHPVRETFALTDEIAIKRLDKAFADGRMKWVARPYWQNGFFGRGEVQITHSSNYKKLAPIVKKHFPGQDIYKNPSLLLVPEISTLVMVHGMVNGLFSGQKLADHGDGNPFFDHAGARGIVNPKEFGSFETIGGYSIKFLAALEKAIPK